MIVKLHLGRWASTSVRDREGRALLGRVCSAAKTLPADHAQRAFQQRSLLGR